MDDSNTLQHIIMVLGVAMTIAALGTMVLSFTGRWIGGSAPTLLAIIAAMVFSFQPLWHSPLFDDVKTDILRRILIASIPAATLLIDLSFRGISRWVLLLLAVLLPPLVMCFAFANHPIDRHVLYLYKVLPVCIAILIGWGLIEPIAIRTPGVSVPLIIGCFTGCAAFILQSTVEQEASRIAPMIPATAAGALAAAMTASLIKKPLSFAGGPVLLWLLLIGSIYTFVLVDTQISPTYLCFLGSIPILAWVCEIPVIHRFKPWKRELLRFALITIPMGIVMFQVYKEIQHMDI